MKTGKQQAAIAALLTAPTIAKAAASIGISEITLWRWTRAADFALAHQEAQRQALGQAIAGLQAAAGEAVKTLRVTMGDETAPPSTKLQAAKAVLEMAFKGSERNDLEARLERLEAALLGDGGTHGNS